MAFAPCCLAALLEPHLESSNRASYSLTTHRRAIYSSSSSTGSSSHHPTESSLPLSHTAPPPPLPQHIFFSQTPNAFPTPDESSCVSQLPQCHSLPSHRVVFKSPTCKYQQVRSFLRRERVQMCAVEEVSRRFPVVVRRTLYMIEQVSSSVSVCA